MGWKKVKIENVTFATLVYFFYHFALASFALQSMCTLLLIRFEISTATVTLGVTFINSC